VPELPNLVATVPFAGVLGMTLTAAEPGEVTGQMPWAADHCTVAGVLHGGALIAFADTLGAVCAFLNLPEGATTSTIESKTSLFRAVRGGIVTGVSRPLHVGRSFIVVQTQLSDDEGRSVALVTQTQAVLS
jgi:1,4-dihydroxy-2-naphthoyl-CoA hydrolase